MSEPAEGWYADPSGANQLRWWDGHAWTDYVEPYEAPMPSPQHVEVAVPAVDEAFPASSTEERASTSAGTPIPMPEASLPQEVTPASSRGFLLFKNPTFVAGFSVIKISHHRAYYLFL